MSNGINESLLMMIQVLIHKKAPEAWGSERGSDAGALVTNLLSQCGEKVGLVFVEAVCDIYWFTGVQNQTNKQLPLRMSSSWLLQISQCALSRGGGWRGGWEWGVFSMDIISFLLRVRHKNVSKTMWWPTLSIWTTTSLSLFILNQALKRAECIMWSAYWHTYMLCGSCDDM